MSDLIGKMIMHYKIIEQVGQGGMGVVYKAHDTKLDRTVALKFLPQEISVSETDKERFLQEAKAAAALNHPNVCVIHDIQEYDQQQFIVMEYVDGKTLRLKIVEAQRRSRELGKDCRLKIDEAIDIAIQIGEALQEAHNKGVVHRDVKSDNIMITASNQVKVMDFGLAKLKGSLKLTKTSSTIGTLAYMAPEQIQGGEVDARSDIFSFGVVIYEMLTGKLPFKGDYEAALMYSILNEEAEPIEKHIPGISSELLHIINRSLEKDPENRYQSIKDIIIDLHRLKRDTVGISKIAGDFQRKEKLPIHKSVLKNKKYLIPLSIILATMISIAVFILTTLESETFEPIPIAVVDFINETDEPELNGLSGMLITALEQSGKLSVLTRSRMFDILKHLNINDIDKIDESLGRKICNRANINAMATATIRKFGKLYTMDFKVLNVDKNEYLFTSKEQGEGQESIPAMIDNLSEKVHKGFKGKIPDKAEKIPTVAEITSANLEAYQHYFKGQELIDKLNFGLAKEEFKKAIKLDSTFGLAYYRLAYAIDWEMNPEHSAQYISKAISLINRIPEKERYLVRALAINKNEGRPAAIKSLIEMEKIYPNDKEMLYNIGDWSYHVGDLVKAKKYLEKVLEMDPQFVRALQHLTWVYRDLGLFEKMFQVGKQYNSISDSKESFELLSDAYIETGQLEEGFQFIKQSRDLHPDRLYLASLESKFYLFQEHYDEAEKTLNTLIEINQPQRIKILGYTILSNFYNYLGRYRESIKAFDYLIDYYWQQKDTSRAAYYHLHKGFRFYEGWNDLNAANNEIQKTFPFHNSIDYNLYWTGLSHYYILNSQFELAEGMAKSTLIKWWHLSVLSLIQNQKNNCNEAKALVDSARQAGLFGAVEILLYYYLSKCYFENNNYDQAIQNLLKIQKINSLGFGFRAFYLPKSFYLLARCYENINELNMAIKYYQKFLDLWKNADEDLPELIDAKSRLANLNKN